ncbi:hypothetical protein METBIDRAFT_115410 [Metschnikowia bicuspidata var. bicuspidata NRRL YB-4993]|uniref:Uncharacterized protein n=1 Tax=Metschnikowia bicuspidata var. bicuspidata NRRL YB-4993 TaxID=869754 RepID=A0A1A0HJ89_9ASCO|nr:hypothetical protein METBIDRAFT_115410 [Metschnikowia bicuspidata var. bicuspidata NRRL YB-4993]OBA23952.1 hypothetical protein METBIDRAFT_115410 [Metschnikowia bicuspidata var. bicuspidata NRRL YB-4993]
MSQERRRLFGSKISSIFSSSDTHHHSKGSEQSLSHTLPLGTKVVGTVSDSSDWKSIHHPQPTGTLTPEKDVRSQIVDASRSSRDKTTDNRNPPQVRRTNSSSYIQSSDGGTSSSQNHIKQTDHDLSEVWANKSPRAKLIRKPPPSNSQYQIPSKKSGASNLEAESKSTHQLNDVINTIEKEIIRMRAEPDELSNGSHSSHPKLSAVQSSDKTRPLKISNSSKGHNTYFSVPEVAAVDLVNSQDVNEGILISSDVASFALYDQLGKNQPHNQKVGSTPHEISKRRDVNYQLYANMQFQFSSPSVVQEDDRQSTRATNTVAMKRGLDDPNKYFSQTILSPESAYSSTEDVRYKDLSPGISSSNQSLYSKERRNSDQSLRRSFRSIKIDRNLNDAIDSSTLTKHSKNGFEPKFENSGQYDDRICDFHGGAKNSRTTAADISPHPSKNFVVNSDQRFTSDLDSSNGAGSEFAGDWDDVVGQSNQKAFEDSSHIFKDQTSQNLCLHSKTGSLTENMNQLVLQAHHMRTHTRMLSVSSVNSAGFNRHVSLATLKMTFSLRPGEGEKSSYVDAIRRNAGTSFNEAGPGKWKLPTGILPVNKRELLQQNSKKFNSTASGTGYKSKKSSGVELKHGHLQPRLLAAEVDDGDSNNRFGALGRSSTLQNKALTPITSKSSLPPSGLGGISRGNSLERADTFTSTSTANDLQSSLSKISSTRRGSDLSSADSIGSITNDRDMDIYYQHQGFKLEDDEDFLENEDLSCGVEDQMTQNNYTSDDEKPRLFLANPDSD